jgi:hypothetical protein
MMMSLYAWCGTNISNHFRGTEQINIIERKRVQVTDKDELGANNILPSIEHGYESQLRSITPHHESNYMTIQLPKLNLKTHINIGCSYNSFSQASSSQALTIASQQVVQ